MDSLTKRRIDRITAILSESNMTKERFAEKIDTSVVHLSRILNGHSNLTEKMAKKIALAFPPVRFEWIMAIDDYKTPLHERLFPLASRILDASQAIRAVEAYLGCLGLKVGPAGEFPDYTNQRMTKDELVEFVGTESFMNVLAYHMDAEAPFRLFYNDTNETICYLSRADYNSFWSEIYDFFEFKLQRMITEANNGKHKKD